MLFVKTLNQSDLREYAKEVNKPVSDIRIKVQLQYGTSGHCCGVKTLHSFTGLSRVPRRHEFGIEWVSFKIKSQHVDFLFLGLTYHICQSINQEHMFQFSDGVDARNRESLGNGETVTEQLNFIKYAQWCGFIPYDTFVNPNNGHEIELFSEEGFKFSDVLKRKRKEYKEKYGVTFRG